MKTVLLLVALAAPVCGFAQTVEGVNLQEKKEIDYIQLLGFQSGLLRHKMTVVVDYGQKIRSFDTSTPVEDENRNTIIFNGMIDALNFFSARGWELFSTSINNPSEGVSIYHYILKRKKATINN